MFTEDWYPVNQATNLANLLEVTRDLSGAIIEIGCWEGKSTIFMAKAAYPEIVICNDTWLGNVAESLVTGQEHLTEKIVKERDVYARFLENMKKETQNNFLVVKEDCLKWLPQLKTPVKFCHIDASHDYESVLDTINLVKPKMIRGGIICGDDYLSACLERDDLHGGVQRAVIETLPNHQNKYNLWFYKSWLLHLLEMVIVLFYGFLNVKLLSLAC
jgi:hypothetical protein